MACMAQSKTPSTPHSLAHARCAPPPPRHTESQENDGQTGTRAQTRPCMRAAHGKEKGYVVETWPYAQNPHNRAPSHDVQAAFRVSVVSSLPSRRIRGCKMEPLPNPAPHLTQLHMLCPLGQALERPWLQVLEWIRASSSALVGSAKQNYVMSLRKCHGHDPAPLSHYNRTQPRHVTVLTTKTVVRKMTVRRGPRAWTSLCGACAGPCVWGGGG